MAIYAADNPCKSGCAHAPGPVRLKRMREHKRSPAGDGAPAGDGHPGRLPARICPEFHDMRRQD